MKFWSDNKHSRKKSNRYAYGLFILWQLWIVNTDKMWKYKYKTDTCFEFFRSYSIRGCQTMLVHAFPWTHCIKWEDIVTESKPGQIYRFSGYSWGRYSKRYFYQCITWKSFFFIFCFVSGIVDEQYFYFNWHISLVMPIFIFDMPKQLFHKYFMSDYSTNFSISYSSSSLTFYSA